jgi:DNA polymerase-1
VASFCAAGVEADDYIATVARRAAGMDWGVVIASADKDFMQLVSERVGLWNPNDKAERVWTAAEVREKTGVAPEQIVDWLSLVGDSADNIPGVPGVGAKTAAGLLGEFGSVDEIYANLARVKSERIRARLAAAAADVRRNQALVRLKDDLPCVFAAESLVVGTADAARLRELYAGWGFRSLGAGVESGPAAQAAFW